MGDGIVEVRRGFFRAHGLGNDYLVFEAAPPGSGGVPLREDAIRRICHRGEGLGSDGLVVLLDRAPRDGAFALRMFNPDGSEFERSGNGLRVLASYLRREGLVGEDAFEVTSGGARILMRIHGTGPGGVHDVSVDMGPARAGDGALPLDASHLDGKGRAVHPELGAVTFVPVSVGNPHAVVFTDEPPVLAVEEVGPFLTTHPAFPEGVNVQLAEVTGPGRLRIGIWERGVGPTSASGTSSCAAAVAAVHTDRLRAGTVEVAMAGGVLHVGVTPALEVTLRGPVAEVATGRLTEAFAAAIGDGG